MAMDDRKMRILQAIIDDYILTGARRKQNDQQEIRHGPFLRNDPE